MPPLVRLFVLHGALGFVLSAIFVAGLLWSDAAGLRSLLLGSPSGYLGLFLLWLANGSVFGGAQIAITVWMRGEDTSSPPGSHRKAPAGSPLPANVRIPARDS